MATKKKNKDVRKLRPCVFCNNENKRRFSIMSANGFHQVVCQQCLAAGPIAETPDEAIGTWNSRQMVVVSEKVYEKMQEMANDKDKREEG